MASGEHPRGPSSRVRRVTPSTAECGSFAGVTDRAATRPQAEAAPAGLMPALRASMTISWRHTACAVVYSSGTALGDCLSTRGLPSRTLRRHHHGPAPCLGTVGHPTLCRAGGRRQSELLQFVVCELRDAELRDVAVETRLKLVEAQVYVSEFLSNVLAERTVM